MRPEQELEGVKVNKKFWVAVVLMVPLAITTRAQAQFYPQPSYGSNVVVVPPSYPGGGNGTAGGYDAPFSSPPGDQHRLRDLLETGGVERPNRTSGAPQGCIYSGQIYSEDAVVRNEAGRQVCGPRAGAEPDASGQLPLSWRAVPGE